MPIERVRMSQSDLAREYPFLEEWFSNPENKTAQLQEYRRLMSAAEKLALVGGKDQVKKNLEITPWNWRDAYTILLACRQDPMIASEIISFGELINRDPTFNLFVNIPQLIDDGQLRTVEGLTLIIRTRQNQFSISGDRTGYTTTARGTRAIARNLTTGEARGFLSGLLPTPIR